MSTEIHEPGPKSDPTGGVTNDEPPLPEGARLSRGRFPGGRWWLDWRLASLLILALLAVLLWRLLSNIARAHPTQPATSGLQPVAVAKVTREDLANHVAIPAEFRPYLQVELHAKVSGYVKEINVDIGDRVKAGQVLAILEVPELLDQLHNAMAVEQRAQAEYPAAHSNYTRLMAVAKVNPILVAEQDLDLARAKEGTTRAAIEAAKAERERYQTLLDYARITAPFDGVVTRRFADPGSLIQAGTTSDTQSKPLVCISDNYRLRLDFPVSVAYVKDIHDGDRVDVRVESLGGKTLTGEISRRAQRVDDETRTMITEIELANPNLELVPGMYAEVLLRVQRRPQALAIPVETVSPGKPPTVFVVNQAQEIEERAVTLGLETPSTYEVLAGLKEGELVVIGRHSQVRPGQKVEAKLTGALARQ